MSWISAADLAKRTGVSRAAVTKAISSGRIPANAVRRSGGSVLVDEAAGQRAILKRANVAPAVEHQAPPMLPADTAELASLFAWGSAGEPEPPPPDVSHLEREIDRVADALECCYARERKFQQEWRAFREWLLGHSQEWRLQRGGINEPSFLEQLREREGDDQRMWNVSVACNEIILPKLSPLDGVALACQYPKEKDTARR